MKVLMLNGSSDKKGTTFRALTEIGETLVKEGIDYEIVQMGAAPVRDCIGCHGCRRNDAQVCIFKEDGVQEFVEKAKEADGFVFGTPVYYAHPSGRVQSFLDRAFYGSGSVFTHKPGAAVAVARRAGTTSSLEVLNKYFTINQMPVVSSTYWNLVYGTNGSEAELDAEGLQTMRNIAHNMAWLLKCIQAGKEEGVCPPQAETGSRTNVIR